MFLFGTCDEDPIASQDVRYRNSEVRDWRPCSCRRSVRRDSGDSSCSSVVENGSSCRWRVPCRWPTIWTHGILLSRDSEGYCSRPRAESWRAIHSVKSIELHSLTKLKIHISPQKIARRIYNRVYRKLAEMWWFSRTARSLYSRAVSLPDMTWKLFVVPVCS